ncbi:MAG: hypothetical protein J6S67_18975 [Methanobrevibacter sp.]|nr:hypothetical protein [Methanobrevibacter sp.]
MTVVVINKTNWNVITWRNVTGITHNATNTIVAVGSSTTTYANANYYVRIMEN